MDSSTKPGPTGTFRATQKNSVPFCQSTASHDAGGDLDVSVMNNTTGCLPRPYFAVAISVRASVTPFCASNTLQTTQFLLFT